MHGPHQVAQKQTTTTLPRWSLSFSGLPSRSSPAISGATRPTFRFGRLAIRASSARARSASRTVPSAEVTSAYSARTFSKQPPRLGQALVALRFRALPAREHLPGHVARPHGQSVGRLSADLPVGVPGGDVRQQVPGRVVGPVLERGAELAHPRVVQEMGADDLHDVVVQVGAHQAGDHDDPVERGRVRRVGADQGAGLVGHRGPVAMERLVLVGDLLRAGLRIELVRGDQLVVEGLLPGREPAPKLGEPLGERPVLRGLGARPGRFDVLAGAGGGHEPGQDQQADQQAASHREIPRESGEECHHGG